MNIKIIEIITMLKKENEEYSDKEAYQDDFRRNLIIISALEKQIPKKPKIYTDVRDELFPDGADKGAREIDTYVCPTCDMYIVECECLEEYMPAYCDDCGQAIDWGNEDE